LYATTADADGNLNNVNHVIIVMQENHSFDNYLGVLPLVPGSPYHGQNNATGSNGGCSSSDHLCVNSLNCTRDVLGNYTCANFNLDCVDSACSVLAPEYSFHDKNYCPAPDLDHGWPSSHLEANFSSPNLTSGPSPNDGFVRVNDITEQHDSSTGESATDDDTMGFYDERDLAYYYALAQSFAIDDQYFCDVVGPTIPNRFYLMAATSFGHLTTNEFLPPLGGYKPITGTIFDLLDRSNISWVDYYSDQPQGGDFRTPVAPHFLSVSAFYADAGAGNLPQVALVDPILFGELGNLSTDEHPPHDIRSGQKFVSTIVDAVRSGPNWKDSIIFIVYDEHGGFYDHVAPAAANQNGAKTPDGIFPGQCADLSNPPASEQPGGGANCSGNPFGTSSEQDALTLCGPPYIPSGAASFSPTGPYPSYCAAFDSLGFRVPVIAVSPFSKPHYVSHTTGDHASILALIEKRFLNGQSLTLRDRNANTLEDMFDFTNSPSLTVSVSSTLAPPPDLVLDGNGSCTQSTGLP
jgi:phospholipase C